MSVNKADTLCNAGELLSVEGNKTNIPWAEGIVPTNGLWTSIYPQVASLLAHPVDFKFAKPLQLRKRSLNQSLSLFIYVYR